MAMPGMTARGEFDAGELIMRLEQAEEHKEAGTASLKSGDTVRARRGLAPAPLPPPLPQK